MNLVCEFEQSSIINNHTNNLIITFLIKDLARLSNNPAKLLALFYYANLLSYLLSQTIIWPSSRLAQA